MGVKLRGKPGSPAFGRADADEVNLGQMGIIGAVLFETIAVDLTAVLLFS